MSMKSFALIATSLLAIAACKDKGKDASGGDKPAAGKAASCNMPKMYGCKQYNEKNLVIGTDGLQKLCESVGGTFAMTPCPTEKRLGACVKREGTDIVYDGYPIPVADVEKDCTSTEGSWQK